MRRMAFGGLVIRLLSGFERAQPLAFAHQHRLRVARKREGIDLVDEGLAMQRGEIEALDPSGPLAEPAPAMRTGDVEYAPEHLAVQAGDLPVAAFGHREGGHAPLEPLVFD